MCFPPHSGVMVLMRYRFISVFCTSRDKQDGNISTNSQLSLHSIGSHSADCLLEAEAMIGLYASLRDQV